MLQLFLIDLNSDSQLLSNRLENGIIFNDLKMQLI